MIIIIIIIIVIITNKSFTQVGLLVCNLLLPPRKQICQFSRFENIITGSTQSMITSKYEWPFEEKTN